MIKRKKENLTRPLADCSKVKITNSFFAQFLKQSTVAEHFYCSIFQVDTQIVEKHNMSEAIGRVSYTYFQGFPKIDDEIHS